MVSSMPSSPLLSVSKQTSASRSSRGSAWCGGGDGYGSALLAVCDQASPSKPRLMWSERHRNTEGADVRAAALRGFIAAVNNRQEVMRSCLLNELCRTVSATRRLNRSCSSSVNIFNHSSSLRSVFSSHAFIFNFHPLPSRVWSGFLLYICARTWRMPVSIGAGASPWKQMAWSRPCRRVSD